MWEQANPYSDMTSAGLTLVVGANKVGIGETLIVLNIFTILEGR